MSQSNWNDFRKDKLRKLLEAEGIQTSSDQTKEELVRLVDLAKSASRPSRHSSKKRRSFKLNLRPITSVLLVLLLVVFLSIFYLYKNNQVFHDNLNYLLKIEEESKLISDNREPQIYERSGKTYVVYDHPLIKVEAIVDQRCLRPECLFDSHLDRVKSNITPLINLETFDYQSRYAKNLIQELDLKLLPVFVFDRNIEKTLNFEKIKKFLDFKQGKYILSTDQSYKSLVNPKLSDGIFLSQNKFSSTALEIVLYGNLTSPFVKTAIQNLEKINQNYPGRQSIILKHFTDNENEFNAAVALSCYLQQEVSAEDALERLTADQEGLLADTEKQLFRRFTNLARRLKISTQSFNNCYTEDTTIKQLVRNHVQEAHSLGITAVPTMLINRNIVQGSPVFEDLDLLINEIAKSEGIELESNPATDEV